MKHAALAVTLAGLMITTACNCGTPPGPLRPDGGTGEVILRPDRDGGVVIVRPTEDGGFVPVVDSGPAPNEVFITGVEPPNGPLPGGTRVLLTGLGFAPDCTEESNQTVFFGDREGIACILTAAGLRVTTPEGAAPGTVDVRVVNDRGESIVPDGFRYFSPVEIDTLDPNSGDVEGGTLVTMTGGGFSDGMVVLVGERQVASLTVIDEENATFVTPPGAVGKADVTASDPFGTFVLELGYTYVSDLRVDRVDPSVVDPADSPFIEVLGAGFTSDAAVTVGGVAAAGENVIDDGRIRLPLPGGVPTGLVDVTVAQGSGSETLVNGLFVLGADGGVLEIEGVAPTEGDVGGGDTITIAGDGFTNIQVVTVGGAAAQVVSSTDRSITIVTPPGTAGAATIVVTTDAGSASAGGFTYVDQFKIEQVQPAAGPDDGGTAVTLTGVDFAAGMTVTVGGQPIADLVINSSTEATGTTPPGSPGPVDVIATLPDGRRAVKTNGFRYETALDLLTVTPTEGGMSGNTFVVLNGEGFTRPGAVNVTFGGTDAFLITVVSDSVITARTPPNAPGVVDVEVSVGSQSDVITGGFTYFDPSDIIGGAGGGAIDGALYVTAFDVFTGLPIPGLSVFLGTDGTADPLAGEISVTNFFGQATLSGPGIRGPQTVSIVGDGYEYATVVDVNASEITLYLQPIGGTPQPPPPPANAPCGDGIIQFPQECDDGMQCDDGQACNEFTCGANPDCLDGYECVVDPAVGERRCKQLECTDGAPCFEYRCQDSTECEESYECVPTGQGFSTCKPLFCEDGTTPCDAQQCDPANDVEAECGVGFTCEPNGDTNRCIPIIGSQYACPAGDVCAPDITGDCGVGGACERKEDCEDGSFCLTRYTDGCTGSPQHGELHCAPDDTLCNQMRQCRPGCEVEITMRGRVFGFAKEFFDPALLGPNEIALALVVTTARDEFSGTPDPCQFNVVFQEGGEYFIARSRPGPLAIVALAGIFNLDTGEFKFRQMGVRRPAFPAPFTHLTEQDIELTIPLDEEIALSLPDAPVGEPDGPTITRMIPFLKFGSDGSLAYTDAISTDRNHDLKRMPDVPGDLITFVGGAFTTNNQGLITDQGLANSIEDEPFLTGIGTNWDETDFFGRPLVEGGIVVVERDDGEKFATTVVTALSATQLLLTDRIPFSGASMEYHIGNPGFPQSEVKQDATGDLTIGGVTINPVLGLPEPTNPVEAGALVDRTMRWKPAPGQQPSVHQMFIFDPFNFEVLWTFYVSGSRTKVPVPQLPASIDQFVELEFMEIRPRDLPVGGMVWQHQAMYIPGFEFNDWTFIDLGLRSRRAWTTDVHLFVNGE
jgi:hypothetical protein